MGGSRSPFEVNRDNAEIFTAGCSRCRENLKYLEISRWYWTDYVKKLN